MRHTPRVRALWEYVRRPATNFQEFAHSDRVGALWQRARRPMTMFAIGVGMAAPASAFVLRTDGARLGAANGDAEASATAAMSTSDLADAQMTVGLSRIYDVPVGLAAEIHEAASAEGIAPRLAFGLVRTESQFRRTAKSPVGAIGYTQVMPATAKVVKPGTTGEDLYDGRTNLHIGFKYLKGLISRYDGDVRLALTAYNRGPGTVDRQLKRGRDPENGYATKVLSDPVTEKLPRALTEAAADRAPAVRTKATAHKASAHVRRSSHDKARASRHKATTTRHHKATTTRHHKTTTTRHHKATTTRHHKATMTRHRMATRHAAHSRKQVHHTRRRR